MLVTRHMVYRFTPVIFPKIPDTLLPYTFFKQSMSLVLFKTASEYDQEILQSNTVDQSKKGGIDQKLILSSTTPDPGYHMGKRQNKIKHHKREPRGQPFPSNQWHRKEESQNNTQHQEDKQSKAISSLIPSR